MICCSNAPKSYVLSQIYFGLYLLTYVCVLCWAIKTITCLVSLLQRTTLLVENPLIFITIWVRYSLLLILMNAIRRQPHGRLSSRDLRNIAAHLYFQVITTAYYQIEIWNILLYFHAKINVTTAVWNEYRTWNFWWQLLILGNLELLIIQVVHKAEVRNVVARSRILSLHQNVITFTLIPFWKSGIIS